MAVFVRLLSCALGGAAQTSSFADGDEEEGASDASPASSPRSLPITGVGSGAQANWDVWSPAHVLELWTPLRVAVQHVGESDCSLRCWRGAAPKGQATQPKKPSAPLDETASSSSALAANIATGRQFETHRYRITQQAVTNLGKDFKDASGHLREDAGVEAADAQEGADQELPLKQALQLMVNGVAHPRLIPLDASFVADEARFTRKLQAAVAAAVHLYGLPLDAAFALHYRVSVLLPDAAFQPVDYIPPQLLGLTRNERPNPQTLYMDAWTPVAMLRTLPPPPSMPFLYEHCRMRQGTFVSLTWQPPQRREAPTKGLIKAPDDPMAEVSVNIEDLKDAAEVIPAVLQKIRSQLANRRAATAAASHVAAGDEPEVDGDVAPLTLTAVVANGDDEVMLSAVASSSYRGMAQEASSAHGAASAVNSPSHSHVFPRPPSSSSPAGAARLSETPLDDEMNPAVEWRAFTPRDFHQRNSSRQQLATPRDEEVDGAELCASGPFAESLHPVSALDILERGDSQTSDVMPTVKTELQAAMAYVRPFVLRMREAPLEHPSPSSRAVTFANTGASSVFDLGFHDTWTETTVVSGDERSLGLGVVKAAPPSELSRRAPPDCCRYHVQVCRHAPPRRNSAASGGSDEVENWETVAVTPDTFLRLRLTEPLAAHQWRVLVSNDVVDYLLQTSRRDLLDAGEDDKEDSTPAAKAGLPTDIPERRSNVAEDKRRRSAAGSRLPRSSSGWVRYGEPACPNPCSALRVEQVTHDGCVARWHPPSDFRRHNQLRYELLLRRLHDTKHVAALEPWRTVATCLEPAAVVQRLHIGTPYQLTVRALTCFGASAQAMPILFRTTSHLERGAVSCVFEEASRRRRNREASAGRIEESDEEDNELAGAGSRGVAAEEFPLPVTGDAFAPFGVEGFHPEAKQPPVEVRLPPPR